MSDNQSERNIEYLPLAELITRLHPQNAKEHDIGAIIESYKTHGYVASGVIDSRTGLFLAGHGRTIALDMMQKQGMQPPSGIRNGGADWLVPIQTGYHSDSDIQAKAYLVADNQLTLAGGWDEPALAELLQEVANSADIALESTGFDADGLDELLRDLGRIDEPPEDPGAQVDRAAELNEKWQVQRGDVWQVGEHRIMCGDSTSAEDVGVLMGGVKADAVVTDPPYNVGIQYGTFTNDNQTRAEYLEWSQRWLNKMPRKRVMTVGIKRLFWWGDIAGVPQWIIAWIKRNGQGNTGLGGTNKWDAILVYGCDVDGNIDIIEVNNDYSEKIKSDGDHPTAKPIELWKTLVERFTDKSDVLIEPFLGSGTTIVACEQTGRVGYGMEIAPDYVAVCLERLSGMGLTPTKGA